MLRRSPGGASGVGAVPDAAYLRTQAMRCRRLARASSTEQAAATLTGMADDYDRQADAAALPLPLRPRG